MIRKITKFEDLDVWQESVQLSVNIYRSLRNCKDYGLRDQIQRAAVSIPSNISEGYERKSNKEYIQYLSIAKGSCGELRTQIYIAKEINLLTKNVADVFIETTQKISAMLYKLIQVRKDNF